MILAIRKSSVEGRKSRVGVEDRGRGSRVELGSRVEGRRRECGDAGFVDQSAFELTTGPPHHRGGGP